MRVGETVVMDQGPLAEHSLLSLLTPVVLTSTPVPLTANVVPDLVFGGDPNADGVAYITSS
ncbi:MAG: hypothetical protein IKR86_04065 [Candidatus Methanomethylophilaceae archaeon]|nr:hypothetical protein [Candidatus Methanomethylophilaceae archaeon]